MEAELEIELEGWLAVSSWEYQSLLPKTAGDNLIGLTILPNPIGAGPFLKISSAAVIASTCDFLIKADYLGTNACEIFKAYQAAVIAEWYRVTFDSRYPGFKVKGRSQLSEQISLEAQVLKLLYRMLGEMRNSGSLITVGFEFVPNDHPLLIFQLLVAESQIALFSFASSDFPTVRDWKKNQQRLNCRPEEMIGFSGQIMTEALRLADKYDGFDRDFYRPLMGARKKLMTHIREAKPLMHHYGIPLRQGKGRQKRSLVKNATPSIPR
ncbi:MAG: hypothetical protein HC924_14320 [Synechococcaceae cyanobacterium SM2_3_2]|nr:hypothetical protein [Synechococcaceae cyanobacterium SM2_3_2]